MGNLNHNTGTVASLVARLGATMFHVLKHLQRMIHQFMALTAVNVDYHTHTACIVLVGCLIETFVLLLFLYLKFAICHIILTLTNTLSVFGCKVISFWPIIRRFAFVFILKNWFF